MSNFPDTIVGIDLGTSNSVVAIFEEDGCKVVPSAEGQLKTPSIVFFQENGEVVVGEVARRQGAIAPERTISSVKRLIGQRLADVEALNLRLPYALTMHDNQLLIDVNGKGYTPSQITAIILTKMKQSAEDYVGHPLSKAVITVPAYFDDLQRQATREAASLAGLEVVRLLNEPTAAAMAYGLGKAGRERIAVFDLGGGTFDLTVLDISENAFEVLTTSGDTHLGGDDIDQALVELLLQTFARQTGLTGYKPDPMGLYRLKEAAEKAKCELSTSRQSTLSLPFLSKSADKPQHLETSLSRSVLEEVAHPFVERCLDICQKAMEDIDLDSRDIDRVLLVGGATRMPLVQEMVEEFFGKPCFKGINPDEVVAIGAACQAGVLSGKLKEVILLEVTPHTLGVEVEGGRFVRIIEKNSTIPAKQSRLFTTIEDDQDLVMVNVLQGESDRADENLSLGRFSLSGVAGGKAGSARVQITFSINSDGMVEVSAEDVATQVSRTVKLLVTGEEGSPIRRSRVSGNRDGAGARRRGKGGRSGRAKQESTGSGSQPIQLSRSREDFRRVRLGQGSPPSQIPESSGGIQLDGGFDPVRFSPTDAVPEPSTKVPSPPPVAFWPGGGPIVGQPADDVGETGSGPRAAISAAGSPDLAAFLPDQDLGSPSKFHGSPDVEIGRAGRRTVPLNPTARRALELIASGDHGESANEVYAAAADSLLAHCLDHLEDQVTGASTAKILIRLGNQGAARRLLQGLGESPSCDAAALSDLYELFLQKFPKDNEASYGLASSLANAGRTGEVIERLENQTAEEDLSPAQIETLMQLYRTKLASDADDHSTQFKLIKLLIRTSKVDEAINLLQRLVTTESYRIRALKILGLCFWRKGLHYLAWQKLQQLPVNDEIRDILYRLSQDMEDTDQVLNAKVVLQHLVQHSPEYKDVVDRLKRVEQLIRIEAGKPEAILTPSIFMTMKDSRFIILEEINRGSMGIVYRAKDKVLDEIVSLKILNDYMTADETAVERFKREARAAKRLAHPNIVRIHDMFEYADKKILSMEYIEGRDLKKLLLERKTLTDQEVARIGRDVAEALAYAHGLGVVHRDIKPANIMITSDNRVKVTDFGIAKMLGGNDVTSSGSQIIGTPLYMSPEQIRGQDIDARIDIYSLGATLYEACCGHPPFVEGNIEYHHLHTVPQPLPESVSPLLSSAIMKCLEKDPAKRWADTASLSQALRQVVEA
jgi:molecular chaperone DnaK